MEIISWWQLYLWTRLDSVNGALTTSSIALVVILIFAAVIHAAMETEQYAHTPTLIKHLTSKTAYISVSILLLLSVTIPSQKDAAMIWVIPKLANSKVLQQEAGDIYKLAKTALKEALGQNTEE